MYLAKVNNVIDSSPVNIYIYQLIVHNIFGFILIEINFWLNVLSIRWQIVRITP